MAGDNVNQYVGIYGTVQYDDRPENHKTVQIGGQDKLVHSVAIVGASTGKTVYVSFFDDSFPGFEHPAKNTAIFVFGKVVTRGEYTNMTASSYSVLPMVYAKKKDAF